MAKNARNQNRSLELSVLLTENELASQFVESFAKKDLPEKFFYWFPLSVRAWLELCSHGAYRNFERSYTLISRHAAELAERLPSKIELFSLGCGQGNKDALLLRAILQQNKTTTYVPLDSSQTLLEMACAEAIDLNVSYSAWKADLTNDAHLQFITRNDAPRVYMILGNTLGAFSPVELCRSISRVSKRGDLLIVDGEIQSQETITGFDNPVNRRFAFAPLASIGISEDDGKLVFESREDRNRPGLYYLAKYFRPAKDLQLSPGGAVIRLSEDEKVEMNFSCKYSREAFLDLIQTESGFQPKREFLSDDTRFLMVLAERD